MPILTALVVALVVAASPLARAEGPKPGRFGPAAGTGGTTEDAEGTWYGGPMVFTDAVALGAFTGAIAASAEERPELSRVFLTIGLGSYLLGGPVVHVIAGRPRVAVASLGLRAGLPLVGAAVGFVAGVVVTAGCGTDGCQLIGGAVGGSLGTLAGLVTAAVVDDASMARRPAAETLTALRLAPLYVPTAHATGLVLGSVW